MKTATLTLSDRLAACVRSRGLRTRSTRPSYVARLAAALPPRIPPAWPPIGSFAIVAHRATAADVVALCSTPWQGLARSRTVGAWQPLAAALAAALRHPVVAVLPTVSHSYRYLAHATAVAAERCGRMVLLTFGRVPISASTGGTGTDRYEAHHLARWSEATAWLIEARELLGLLPALPAGWRWTADELGPAIRRLSDGWTWHPSVERLAGGYPPDQLVADALRDWERQRVAHVAARHDRAARLLARVSAALTATLQDARQAGYCEQGIRVWCGWWGWDPEQPRPLRDLLATNDQRAIRVAVAVARRAMQTATA